MYKTQYIAKYITELKNPASDRDSGDNGHLLKDSNRVPNVSYWGNRGLHRPLGFCSIILCLNFLGGPAVKNILKITKESYKEHTHVKE